jgi:hypothetical protein
MFVGSSVEGLPIARAIQIELDHDCEVTLWSQGVFGLGQGTLEALVRIIDRFDFAILVLTPDDLVESRGRELQGPRDNVLFELGLFMGGLGRDRTFVVHDRSANLKMPTDLAGVTTATFEPRSDDNLQAALGAVCARIAQVMRSLGKRSPPPSSTTPPRTPRTLSVPPSIMVTGGRDKTERKSIDAAYEFGRLITDRDVRLLSGIAEGVDEAFCRGVVESLGTKGKDSKRLLTCYTGKGRSPVHQFGKIVESRYRSREEGVPELVSECDIAILFGGAKNTHYLGVLTLLEGRILIPVASTGGAAADLYSYVLSRFDIIFAGRLDKNLFTDLADLNNTPIDIGRMCFRIVEALSKPR